MFDNINKPKSLKGYCYLMGATGPTGPTGAATIQVGKTTTTNPGMEAKVVNSGTNENVILDFTIPCGATGPKGEQGIQGLPGTSDTIEFRNTKTGDPGTKAMVTDTTGSPHHIIDFIIPQGPKGDLSENVFAYKYNESQDTIELTQNQTSIVALGINGDANKISVTLENSMIINEYGIYKIEYFFSGAISEVAALTVGVLNNNVEINGTEISKDVLVDTDTDFNGTTITKLNEKDIINIGIRANKNVTLSPAPDLNSYLIITKLK